MRRRRDDFSYYDDDDDFDDDGRNRKKDEKPFDPSNREERSAFDNPADSKLSRRQGRASRFGGIGALGGLSIWNEGARAHNARRALPRVCVRSQSNCALVSRRRSPRFG